MPNPSPSPTFRTDIGYSEPDRITLFGRDFVNEILGEVNLGDMGFLELTGRLPNANESRMFNAMAVTLVEHGITPSALVARLTYLGAPESLQGAVAAGLNGLGTVFVGSIEGAARVLYEAMPQPDPGADLPALARDIVQAHRDAKQLLPGTGHPIHKPIDPRVPRLQHIARETGFDGPYLKLMAAVADEATRATGTPLPMNATGAIGALCCELGFPWRICRGIGVMARAVGLVGHILEESRQPMAAQVWHRVDAEATEHLRADALSRREQD